MRCVLLCGIILCAAHLALAQISPGPLSKAHQNLEGVTKCASCHEFGAGARGFKCVDCHGEIKRRIDARTGLHARVIQTNNAGQKECARCHVEHQGDRVPLTRLTVNGFDHGAQTGFVLQGKHRQLQCAKCHNAKHVLPAARQELKQKDLNRTYLGLGRECLACHEDRHAGQLGTACTNCHSQDAWKPANGFNHSKTSFALTGLHQAVACQKCHVPAGAAASALKYKGLQFASCQNCHKDPHQGAFVDAKFRGSCESCHDTGGWKKNHPASKFNHALTKFDLRGKHATVACLRCHKDSNFNRPVAHARCQDCHEDPHKGQFQKRLASLGGGDCGACHTETGFKPSLFDRAAHRKAAFPLEEKHATVACDRCHTPAGKAAVYISAKTLCRDCHADQHAGQFSGSPWKNDCRQCHTQNAFAKSTFTAARHSTDSKFHLTGKHVSVECAACHKPLPLASTAVARTVPPRDYRIPSSTCTACHADPHKTKQSCETCHSTQQWTTVAKFDHAAQAKFPLDASHAALQCRQCHDRASTRKLSFSETPTHCFSCHQDVHGNQFLAAEPVEDCAQCHTPTKWTNKADFDHDRTRFPFDRAHRGVACQKCHKEQKEVLGKMIAIYRGTPTECTKCH